MRMTPWKLATRARWRMHWTSHAFVCSRIDRALLNPKSAARTHPQRTGLITGEMTFLPFAGAGILGIRRSLFEEIVGFDWSISSNEEADLCWRLQLAGHQPPVFVPDATLHCRLEQRRTKRWRKTLVFGRRRHTCTDITERQGCPANLRPNRSSLGATS